MNEYQIWPPGDDTSFFKVGSNPTDAVCRHLFDTGREVTGRGKGSVSIKCSKTEIPPTGQYEVIRTDERDAENHYVDVKCEG